MAHWPLLAACGGAARQSQHQRQRLPGRVGDERLKPAAHRRVHSENQGHAHQQGGAAHQETRSLEHQPEEDQGEAEDFYFLCD